MNLYKYLDYFRHGGRMLYKGKMLPCYVTFFVTSRCNLRCSHCLYWRKLNSVENELTLDEISRISGGMGNILLLMLTGGESILRDDLADIAEIFCKNNNLKNLIIPTNGYHTSRVLRIVEDILRRAPDTNVTVNLPLDGLGEKHDKIRGIAGAFTNAVKTANELILLKAKYPNLNVGISMTMMHENQEEIASTYSFARDKIMPDCVSLSIIRGDTRDPGSREIDINKFESISKIMDERMKGYGGFPFSSFTAVINALVREQLVNTVRRDKWAMPCYAGRVNAVIYPDGDVYFCELLNKKIGNLRDAGYDFRRIWHSSEADNTRRFIKKERCFCIHVCNIYTNLLFNPLNFLRILGVWSHRRLGKIFSNKKYA